MTSSAEPRKPKARAPREPHGDDWLYDELMTAQPDATREFFRERLRAPAAPAEEKRRR